MTAGRESPTTATVRSLVTNQPPDVRFERLYRDHFRAVFAYVLRRAGAPADAPDLVADVFTVAWRRLDQVPPPPDDRPWLYGVARRVVAQHNRSRFRRGRLLLRLGSLAPGTGSATDHVGTDRWAGPSAEERVAVAVAALRPADRELLHLVAWERLSHAEAAVVLGCSTNAVAIRWHRLMKRLNHRLAGDLAGRPGDTAAGPAGEAPAGVEEPVPPTPLYGRCPGEGTRP